jgi:formylglycine-generating enzyme required for sulfatase activity
VTPNSPKPIENNPNPGQPSGRSSSGGRPRLADLGQLLDTLQKEEVPQVKLLTNSAGIKLILIPAGSFLMGSPESEVGHRLNEALQHEITITRPFYLGVHPITQEQYQRVTGRNPSRFQASNGGGPDHPVENVSWEEAVAFCRQLSAWPEEKQAGRVYRLPTEAEWEHACRGGTTLAFGCGGSLSALQANFDGNYPYQGQKGPALSRTTRVGSYPANNFGLCDMHGNVWEWCADWYDERYYLMSPKRDPQGPASGQVRVLRGGSWRNQAVTCRAAYRNGLAPTKHDSCTGFRVVAELLAQPAAQTARQ